MSKRRRSPREPGLWRRLRRRREPVPSGPTHGPGRPDEPDEGGAGVREPRRPNGPGSMTAEADEPRDQHIDLSSEDLHRR